MYKNKFFVKSILVIVLFLIACVFVGCDETSTPALSFKNTTIEVKVGREFELEPIITGIKGENLVRYSFDKEGYITNKNGNVFIAVAAGDVTITGSIVNYEDIKASIKVTITEDEIITKETIKDVISGEVGNHETTGVVVAISQRSFLLADDTAKVLVYRSKEWECDLKVGDKVAISGETSLYGGAIQFCDSATYEKQGSVEINKETAKEVKAEDLETLKTAETFNVEYVKLQATLSVSGTYYNLTLAGTEVVGSISYPSDSETLKSYDGKLVEVIGYGVYMSESSTKYYNIILESIACLEPVITGETEVEVGETITLNVSNATGEIIWSSDNEEIATVSDGVVTGKAKGQVIIMAEVNGAMSQIEITVNGKMYSVKFFDIEGILISEVKVAEGENAEAPAIPEVEGYTFVKWNRDFENVQKNLIVKALYGLTHTIRYELNGGILSEDAITEYGEGYAYVLEKPVKKGYRFLGWVKEEGSTNYMNHITSTTKEDLVLYACYAQKDNYNVVYDFNGGYSDELYAVSGKKVAEITIDNYNYSNGNFWDGTYSTNIFLGNSSCNPKAEFSDRIYIGKDSETKLWKIINIQTSNKSVWPEGAEYVLSISSHYGSYRTVHNEVTKLKNGYIVGFSQDFTLTTNSSTTDVYFYEQELTKYELTVNITKGDTLITPTRLGFEFVGWFDETGEKYDSYEDFADDVTIIAKWNELNPVTDIAVKNMPSEMKKGETVQVSSSVVPSDAYFKQVIYSTSDKDIISISDTGLLTAINAGTATITITDYIKNVVKEYEIVVYPITSLDITFDNDYTGVLKIGDKVNLKPYALGKDTQDLTFTYSSSNNSIITVDANGNVEAIGLGTAFVTIKDNKSLAAPLEVAFFVDTLSTEDKLDKVLTLLKENNFGVVETGNACLFHDSSSTYYDAVYGSVNRYLFDTFEINRSYEATAEANKSGHKDRRSTDQIEFVTVHDTATLTGTVESIASVMSSGETSIHYTVGNDKIYSVVPEKYIAYHAGDGTGTVFEWIPSGVKTASNTKPDVDLVKVGSKYYFTINGEKSNVEAPISNGSQTIANPSKNSLPVTGPVWKVVNGEYYLGTSWVCFSQNINGIISNHGGNNNSIGIEMNVNTSNDIYDTWQRTARLVADILIRNKLDTTRVMMHNNWSGKNCPQVLIAGNYWNQFMKMVELNYILVKDYADVEISMKSNNPTIVDNTGRVIKAPSTTQTVSYEVTVKSGNESKSVTLYSVVHGTTTWEQWNGLYASTKVWNNGVFAR